MTSGDQVQQNLCGEHENKQVGSYCSVVASKKYRHLSPLNEIGKALVVTLNNIPLQI